jgi:hypothetical protein
MGLFGRDRPAGPPLKGGADGVFEVLGADGRLVRYTADDFDEIWTTTDEHEAGHHVDLGWIVLEESVSRDGGKRSFVDEFFRRQAGRVLPSGDDPGYVPPSDETTYVLGYLKPGREGSPSA